MQPTLQCALARLKSIQVGGDGLKELLQIGIALECGVEDLHLPFKDWNQSVDLFKVAMDDACEPLYAARFRKRVN